MQSGNVLEKRSFRLVFLAFSAHFPLLSQLAAFELMHTNNDVTIHRKHSTAALPHCELQKPRRSMTSSTIGSAASVRK